MDEVVERLVDISKVEGHLDGASPELRERLEASLEKLTVERTSAMSWLTEAYAVLIESAASRPTTRAAVIGYGIPAQRLRRAFKNVGDASMFERGRV